MQDLNFYFMSAIISLEKSDSVKSYKGSRATRHTVNYQSRNPVNLRFMGQLLGKITRAVTGRNGTPNIYETV